MRKDQVFLLACFGYIVGVLTGSFFIVSWWWILLFGAGMAAVFTVFPRKNIVLLALPFTLFSFGVFSAASSLQEVRNNAVSSQTVTGMARVIGDTEEKQYYRQTVIRMEVCEQGPCPTKKILWHAPLSVATVPGMKLQFSCALAPPENFDPAFDYVMFLAKDDIGYICREADAVALPEDVRARLLRVFYAPKRALESALEKSLPQPEAGLSEGLILGGDNRLPETLKQAFVKAGLSHIVAISGYNIALIAQGFVVFGIVLGMWRRRALWFAVVGITAFIFFVGAPPSAVRAGIMAGCVFAALCVGRLSRSFNLLVFAAALMLYVEPLLLRYDVGFQLSFLAMLAIIGAQPWVERALPRVVFWRGVAEIALFTLAVELLVVPLIAYQFHIFSPYALVANVLLLPLVPYAMALSFIGALGFLVIPGLHLMPSALAYMFLRTITSVAEWTDSLSGAAITVSLDTKWLLLWYGSLFFVMVTLRKYWRRRYVKEKNIL